MTMYVSGAGDTPTEVLLVDGKQETNAGMVSISRIGDGVQIYDKLSGAIFAFEKWSHTYYFTVRMGEDVFDGSLGLLITGCANPINISAGATKRRRRNTAECESACATAPHLYRETCVFDCDVTGDLESVQASIGASDLEQKVQEVDEKVLTDLSVPTTPLPTPTTATKTTRSKTIKTSEESKSPNGSSTINSLTLLSILMHASTLFLSYALY